jgi:hypothetical protein
MMTQQERPGISSLYDSHTFITSEVSGSFSSFLLHIGYDVSQGIRLKPAASRPDQFFLRQIIEIPVLV